MVEELFIHQTDFGRSLSSWNCHRVRGFPGTVHSTSALPPGAVHVCFVLAVSTWPQGRWLNLHNTWMLTAGAEYVGQEWATALCAYMYFLRPPRSQSSSGAVPLAKQPVWWGGEMESAEVWVGTCFCSFLMCCPASAILSHASRGSDTASSWLHTLENFPPGMRTAVRWIRSNELLFLVVFHAPSGRDTHTCIWPGTGAVAESCWNTVWQRAIPEMRASIFVLFAKLTWQWGQTAHQ